MLKRLIAIILSGIIILGVHASYAANNTRVSGLYTYEFKGNGTLRIIDFNWSRNTGDIYIPSMIDGYEVAIIGERAFELGDGERSADILVTLPNTITAIEDFAFYNAPVTAINIPLNTQSIGEGALLVQQILGISILMFFPDITHLQR